MKRLTQEIQLFTFIALSFAFTVNGQSHYPMEEGKVWYYNYAEDFAVKGTSLNKVEIQDEMKVLDGVEYFEIRTSSGDKDRENFRLITTFYLRERKDGTIVGKSASDSSEVVMLPEPPYKEGSKWDNSEGIMEILQTDASIETPAGTFDNCLLVKTQMNNVITLGYFQKGVGHVALEMVINGEKKLVQYLVE